MKWLLIRNNFRTFVHITRFTGQFLSSWDFLQSSGPNVSINNILAIFQHEIQLFWPSTILTTGHYSWVDKLTSYSSSVVQWFHRRLWAPLVVYWRKYTRSYGENKYFDLNIHIFWKIWRFTTKWRGAFLLGIKFPFMRVQMENIIFYRLPLAYW